MKLEEIMILIGEKLEVRFPDIEGNYMFSFERGEISRGCVLESVTGRGKTPNEARADFIPKISGKTIVFHAMDKEKRREYKIPEGVV